MIEPVEGSIFDTLVLIAIVIGIVLFSILAGRAEGRLWRAIRRHNGDRRTTQQRITEGKSHLR